MRRHFFENLNQLKKVYVQQMGQVCAARNLTMNELEVLLFLYENPSADRSTDIVTYQAATKSQVSMSVNHLEELGLLTKLADADDRRIVHLRLTEQAMAVVEDAAEQYNRFSKRMLAGVTEEEMKVFWDISRKINENIKNC